MEQRVKKLERMLALQEKVHRLQEWRLQELDHRQAENAESRARLFDTLNRDHPLHSLFVDAMARRLNVLARENDRLSAAREQQSRRLLDEGLRMKRIERMSGRIRREHVEQLRKRGFSDLLDSLAKLRDASLP
ncbi:hypothetical protein BH10PSE9_BH10PSE9_07730 [soil metagenome]